MQQLSPLSPSYSSSSSSTLTGSAGGSQTSLITAPIIEEEHARKRSASRGVMAMAMVVGSAGAASVSGLNLSGSGRGLVGSVSGDYVLPFSFESGGATEGKPIGTYFAQGIEANRNLFAVGGPGNEFIFSCGYWDNSFRVGLAATGVQTQRVARHRGPVTCVRYCPEKGVLATGSRDTTVMLWKFVSGEAGGVFDEPIHTLYGHDDEVTSLDASIELDVVVSGSRAGHIIVHTLRDGRFAWSTRHTGTISLLRISPAAAGAIVAYSKERHTLYLHSVNGRLLAQAEVHDSLHDLVITRDGKHLVTAGKNTIEFWDLHNLCSVHRLLVPSPVLALDISPEDSFLAAGLSDGCIAFVMRCDAVPTSLRPLNAIRMTFSKFAKGSHSSSSSTVTSPPSVAPAACPQSQQPQMHSSLSSISEYI